MTPGVLVGALCGMGLDTGAGVPVERPDRPHILWLTFEDSSEYLFGAYGNTQVKTPVFDTLAERGILFTRASSVAPQCSPARSSLISGCYATTWGHDQHRGRRLAAPDIYLFPRWLRESGYFCSISRKTDWNNDEDALAPHIDAALNVHGRDASYNDPAREPGQPFFSVFNNVWTHMNAVATIKTDFRWPRRQGLHPDLLILPPHVPDLPEIREDYAEHLAQVERLDAWFGVFLDDLAQRGLLEDTILFLFADHGGCLPRGKGYPYETGFRVPLVIVVPPRWQPLSPWPPGTRTDELVSFIDFGPTVLSLAGIAPPDHMQGRAFMGLHAAPPPSYQFNIRANSHSWYDPARTVSDGRYVYIRNYTPYKPFAMWHGFQSQMPAQRAWDTAYLKDRLSPEFRSFHDSKPAEMLFDIESDPGQMTDLASDPQYADKVLEFRDALSAWHRETRDKGLVPLQMRDREAPDRSLYDRMESPDFPLEPMYQAAKIASLAAPEDLDALMQLTNSEHPEIRYWGVVGMATLARRGYPVPVKRLNTLLDDSFIDIACAAAEALWFAGERDVAYRHLKEAFAEGVPNVGDSLEMIALAGEPFIDGSFREEMISDLHALLEIVETSGQKMQARVILNRLGALDVEDIYTPFQIEAAERRYHMNKNYYVEP